MTVLYQKNHAVSRSYQICLVLNIINHAFCDTHLGFFYTIYETKNVLAAVSTSLWKLYVIADVPRKVLRSLVNDE